MKQSLFLNAVTTDSSNSPIVGEATKKVNAFSAYWQHIDWNNVFNTVLSKIISLLLVTLFAIIIQRLGKHLIKRSFKKYEKRDDYNVNRVTTLHSITSNVFRYTIFFIYAYTILTIIGVPVGSLLAGAGIAGLAIGLGAQGFINDLITGFFIIFEQQLDVGDVVRIKDIEGTVRSVGLRTTTIKNSNGTVHFVPNHLIEIVSNHSIEDKRIVINVRITQEANVKEVEKIMSDVNEKLSPTYSEITGGPTILGLIDLDNGNYAVSVEIYTHNDVHSSIQSDFLEAYIAALSKQGIQIPNKPLALNIAYRQQPKN